MAVNFTNTTNTNFTYDYYFGVYEKVSIFSAVFLSLVALATVVANGISLFAIYKDPLKCFRNPFAVFITGILVSDFLTGLVVEPVFVTLHTLWMVEYDEESYMKIFRSCQVLSTVTINTSFFTVLALAVAQLMALRWPSAYRSCVSTPKAILGVVLIWVYCILFALIPVMTKVNEFIYFLVDLILHRTAMSVSLVVIYIIIYFMFVRAMRRHQTATDTPEGPQPQNEDETNQDEEHKPDIPIEKIEKDFLVGSFMLIVVLILTVWPFSISFFILIFRKGGTEDTFLKDYIAATVFDDFLFLKFVLDPLVFVWRLPKYRKAISISVFSPARVKLLSVFHGGSLPSASYRRQDQEGDSGEERLIAEREWSADISGGVLEIKGEEA